MCEYTLVVVDMQPFYTKDASTIANVLREVEAARQGNCNIIFLWVPYLSPLQEAAFEPTHRAILDVVKDYDKAHWAEVSKLSADGAYQVLNACRYHGFASKRFRVCGVNTDLCVLDTVNGLLERCDAIVEVVKDACNTTSKDRDTAWQKFPVNPRLVFVS